MLRIYNTALIKKSQSFLDEMKDIDWDDEDTEQDQLSRQSLSPGLINDDNYEDVLSDNVDDINNQSYYIDDEENTGEDEVPSSYLDEIPRGNQDLGIPQDTREIEYENNRQLVYDGIDSQEVISFDYTNRNGVYTGLRTVEPHYTFVARTTGNEVLVTFDREQNDIRAFILDHIHPYGIRYKNVHFQVRPEIMQGVY